ncbi:uncharacterized protein ACIB01_005671 isoform 1-T1 [Guaruba guarouba]
MEKLLESAFSFVPRMTNVKGLRAILHRWCKEYTRNKSPISAHLAYEEDQFHIYQNSRHPFFHLAFSDPELSKNLGGDPLHMLTMVTRHEKQYERPTQTPGGGSALIIMDPGAEDWQNTMRNGCTSIPLNSISSHRGQEYGEPLLNTGLAWR